MQAASYPQACLSVWKKREPLSTLMEEVIQKANQYFDGLSQLVQCPARTFHFPGYAIARDKACRVFSTKVSKQAKEMSVFAKFARHFEIIYGNQWATSVEGKLGDPSPFSEFSHTMEFPRLEVIDPEGMAIRRFQASARIEELKVQSA